MKKYPEAHPWDLEPYYTEHIAAMTTEDLHYKCDIAAQLALRDKRIAFLEEETRELRKRLP